MLRPRIIPVLLLRQSSLVKTIKFNKFSYIGDPCNTVRIFNELEVDEISLLDIQASKYSKEIQYETIQEVASEAFMPLSYGGGIKSLEQAKRIFGVGVEKVILNSSIFDNPELITKIANIYGSQAVVVSVDVRKSFFSKTYKIYSESGNKKISTDLINHIKRCESLGAGEILLNSINRDGTWQGYDFELLDLAANSISIPLIGCGGAKNFENVTELFKGTSVSAAGVGSMVLFQKQNKGVLINYPKPELINSIMK